MIDSGKTPADFGCEDFYAGLEGIAEDAILLVVTGVENMHALLREHVGRDVKQKKGPQMALTTQVLTRVARLHGIRSLVVVDCFRAAF